MCIWLVLPCYTWLRACIPASRGNRKSCVAPATFLFCLFAGVIYNIAHLAGRSPSYSHLGHRRYANKENTLRLLIWRATLERETSIYRSGGRCDLVDSWGRWCAHQYCCCSWMAGLSSMVDTGALSWGQSQRRSLVMMVGE